MVWSYILDWCIGRRSIKYIMFHARGIEFRDQAQKRLQSPRTRLLSSRNLSSYIQSENGDMGSKRLSRVVFEEDWIVEYLKTLLGLMFTEKQECYGEIRLARPQNQIPPHEKPRSYPYRKTVNPTYVFIPFPLTTQFICISLVNSHTQFAPPICS